MQHDIGKRGGQSRQLLAFDLDEVIRKDAPAGRTFYHPVDLDSSGKNKLIGLAARTIAGSCDELVEPGPVLQIFLWPRWRRAVVPWSRGGMTILGRSGGKLIGTTLGASIAAAEKRGFGVHALEVWQKSSHVKRTGECHRRQSQTPEKFRYMLTGPRLFLKCSLSKNIWRKIFCLVLERGVSSSSSHG